MVQLIAHLVIMAASVSPKHEGPSSRSSIHTLRGGSMDGKALSRDEVTNKLNAVPTFVIAGDDDKFVALDGKICFFVDGAEAKEALELTASGNPDVPGLHLIPVPLGTAFTVCGGWLGEEPSTAAGDAIFVLQGPSDAIETKGEEVKQKAKAMGTDLGDIQDAWVLPVFFSDDFQMPSMMPLFFCQKDLEGGYVRAGNPPDGTSLLAVDCMDLRGLVTSMLHSDAMPWAMFQLVSSPASYDLARELREQHGAASSNE